MAGSANEADSPVFHLFLHLNFTTTTRSGILSATWMWERSVFFFLFHVFRIFVECMIIALSKGRNIAKVLAPWEHSKPWKDCRLELKTEDQWSTVVHFILFMKNIWFVAELLMLDVYHLCISCMLFSLLCKTSAGSKTAFWPIFILAHILIPGMETFHLTPSDFIHSDCDETPVNTL